MHDYKAEQVHPSYYAVILPPDSKEGVILPPQVCHQLEGLVYTTSSKYTGQHQCSRSNYHKMYIIIVITIATVVEDHARYQHLYWKQH